MTSTFSLIVRWLLCVVCFSAATPAFAQKMTFKVLTDRVGCGDCVWVQASGEIQSDVADEFKSFLKEHPYVSVVQIDSAGGSLTAALEMGEFIRSRSLSVVVGGANIRSTSTGDQIATRVAGQCMSACVYVLAAGQSRSQLYESQIGVHQFYDSAGNMLGDAGLDAGQRVSGVLIDYLTTMGVSPSMISTAAAARPDEIYILSNTEMLRFKLLTSVQEQYSQAPGYGRAIGVASTGSDPFGDMKRVPPSSIEECGKARFSLVEAGSVASMQSRNRFFRDVCNSYFDAIESLDGAECQEPWDQAYEALEEHVEGTALSTEMQLVSVKSQMSRSALDCFVEIRKREPRRPKPRNQ